MTNWINLGGIDRPVSFGYIVARTYELETGGNYNQLISNIITEISKAGQAMQSDDLVGVAISMNVTNLSDLVYFGMKHACRREGIEIDFTADDVADWLFTDSAALARCLEGVTESLPRPGKDDKPQESAKKKSETVYPQSTGKNLSKRQP